jgi:hypothetical protein
METNVVGAKAVFRRFRNVEIFTDVKDANVVGVGRHGNGVKGGYWDFVFEEKRSRVEDVNLSCCYAEDDGC